MVLESLENRIDAHHLDFSRPEGTDTRETNMGPAVTLFEELAAKTWNRLRCSIEMKISQGEETLTDNNLLELKMSGIKQVKVSQCPRSEEKREGIDWDWLIGSDSLGWLRYAVQAKKANSKTHRYDGLSHMVGHAPQIKLLESHAKETKAIPVYCLYNYVKKDSFANYWHCNLACDPNQLGCTIAPLTVVMKALATRGGRRFDSIHLEKGTVPWRCLVRCQHILRLYQHEDGFVDPLFGPIYVHRHLPPDIRELFEVGELSTALSTQDFGIVAKRVMVVTLEERELT